MGLYEYRAIITSVYDADSCRARLDLGFGIYKADEALRLAGINAPEMRGDTLDLARAARDALRLRVLGKLVTIRTHKDAQEKYGRYLAEIWDEAGSVNAWLVEAGYAVPYMV